VGEVTEANLAVYFFERVFIFELQEIFLPEKFISKRRHLQT